LDKPKLTKENIMLNFIPLNNRALVEIPVPEIESKLIIPDDIKRNISPPQKSKVVAVSTDGNIHEFVEVGDYIMFDLMHMEIIVIEDMPYGLVDKGIIKGIIKQIKEGV